MRSPCRLGSLAVGAMVLLVGCQSPVEPTVPAALAPATSRVAAPPVADPAAADEAIRIQYRRIRAKELVEEARVLRLKHRFGDASKKMDEANKLLEGLPEEE